MPDNVTNKIDSGLSKIAITLLLGLGLTGCFGVDSDNPELQSAGDDPNTPAPAPTPTPPTPQPTVVIPDRTLADVTVRARPTIDTSLGYNVILSDLNTLLRGVSLSFDGGDPYDPNQIKKVPTAEQLSSLVNDYGFNTVHVYLEGDAAQNPDPVGINETIADELVALTREAKMYLIITVGNNGENGAIHSMEKTLDFWRLYANKYKDETHVIFEAHNEPVSLINENWTDEDWERQAQMYQTIREAAPDTMILLGSFMSFFGGPEAISGADGLKEQFPNIWDNAGFAFHAYWDLPGVEQTIDAFKTSTEYPALLNTEFWPGDTKNGYNEAFETHNIGWMQFEWLGANDLDLDNIKNSLDEFGTVWRPETADATWPAIGTPTIPFGEEIGLYSRGDELFLNIDDANKLIASDNNFDGVGNDTFVVEDAGDDGFVALRAENGNFLSVTGFGMAMTATAETIGTNERLMWLELPSGDIALRPWAGSGHLIGTVPEGDNLDQGFTGSVGDGALLNGHNTYRVVGTFTAAPLAPLEEPSGPAPGPFFGSPTTIPTNGGGMHPFNDDAPNGRLWMADFDYGGQGVAYNDNDVINKGDAYRFNEGVDVQASSEGYTAIGFFDNEEWLEYTVDVLSAGNYIATIRTASGAGGGSLSIEANCVNLTGTVATPNTNGWDTWQDMTVEITLEAGIQKLRVVSGGGMNIMNMDIQPGGNGSTETTEGCQWVPEEPSDIFVEAEDWDAVIELPEGEVVLENTTDASGGQNVGFIDAGDWMEYTISVPETACYRAGYRVASDTGSDGFELRFDGELLDTVAVPDTGGWQSWLTLESGVELIAGEQTMRFDAVGGEQNINYFEFNIATPSVCADEGEIVFGENLLNNASFDDNTGWTAVNQYGPDVDGNAEVTISGGAALFSETVAAPFSKHMGLYTAVELQPGIYQFDMDVSYSEIAELWGEVYIGTSQPVENVEYNGEQQVLKVYNAYECDTTTYSGLATETGCDNVTTPGRFEIETAGTYYLLFRSGGNTFGNAGILLDNWSLREVNPSTTPEPNPQPTPSNYVNNDSFDDASGWESVNQYGDDVDGNALVTIADGVATFSETVAAPFSKHMGMYTVVDLPVGVYQFDMDVSYAEINELWGEVYIGSEMPVVNTEYNGDQQILVVYNAWDCPDAITYTGLATQTGCDSNDNPGQFEITTSGAYYLLFRSGGNTFGTQGIVMDNWSISAVE